MPGNCATRRHSHEKIRSSHGSGLRRRIAHDLFSLARRGHGHSSFFGVGRKLLWRNDREEGQRPPSCNPVFDRGSSVSGDHSGRTLGQELASHSDATNQDTASSDLSKILIQQWSSISS